MMKHIYAINSKLYCLVIMNGIKTTKRRHDLSTKRRHLHIYLNHIVHISTAATLNIVIR